MDTALVAAAAAAGGAAIGGTAVWLSGCVGGLDDHGEAGGVPTRLAMAAARRAFSAGLGGAHVVLRNVSLQLESVEPPHRASIAAVGTVRVAQNQNPNPGPAFT
eukprot:SAG31_NODE_1913_length_6933_cov_9.849722_9_plen_104_part_00